MVFKTCNTGLFFCASFDLSLVCVNCNVVFFSYGFEFVNRTLCPVDKTHRQNMTQQLIYIDVSTMSLTDVEFTFSAKVLPDFQIQ